MKAPLVLVAALILISCGTAVKRPLKPGPAPPPEVRWIERGEAEESDREDSPEEATEFYLLKRTGGAPLSMDRVFEARRHARTMPHYAIARRRFVAPRARGAAPREANLGTWQPLGPGNAGGRTRALVIRQDDPNIMYAGSVGGGVWKTTDGGNSWNPLTDLLPSLGISTLAMDPQQPDTLYAGTGEYFTGSTRGDSIRGAGIFKTTDGGATWNQLPGTNNSSFYYVNKIVVSPSNGEHIYAATYGGVWYSANAGVSWTRVLDRTGSQLGCQDLAIRSDQATDYLFAACAYPAGDNPAIYRNTNAAEGGQWQIVFTAANMSRTTLALAPSNQSIIYALAASTETGNYANGMLGVFRSDSNGDPGSWTMQVSNKDPNPLNTLLLTNPRDFFGDVCNTVTKSFANQGTYDNVIAVDPINPEVVWAGGIDIFRSDDGGRNWGIAAFWEVDGPQGSHADNHVLVFHPRYNGGDNQTLFAASDGGIYRTDNALAATATGPRAGCAPFATSVAWTSLNNGYAVTQFYHGSIYPGGAAYVGGTQDNGTQRGSDASGQNWVEAIGGDGGFTAIDPNDPNTWYGETTRLNFRKTTNGNTFASSARGITEASSNFQFIAPFVMDPSDSKRLYLGGRTLWRTIDAAANWTEASSALPTANGNISSIAVSPKDPNRVVFGTSVGFIYRNSGALTTDRTAVWPFAQPRTGYISSLTFDPENPEVLYATYSQYKQTAAQSHVYRSTDGGATWAGIDGAGSTGLPDIPVFSLLVDPQNPTNLYLGTDIGLFVSVDSGASWARDDNPFADAVTEKVALDRSSGQDTLIAFTHGRGVWKTVLPGSGSPCQYRLSAESASFSATGGTASIRVEAADHCAWSAVPPSNAYTISSPAGRKGSGSFTISAGRNTTLAPRSGRIAVQSSFVEVTQDAAQAASGHDAMASAFELASPGLSVADSTNATESPDDPMHSCTQSRDSKTLWYRITAPSTGTMQLGFSSARFTGGTDAGAVMTAYLLTDGAAGPQLACSVTPQATNVLTTRFANLAVREGLTYLIEVSATTFNAPAGAAALPGRVVLFASMQN